VIDVTVTVTRLVDVSDRLVDVLVTLVVTVISGSDK
jgi:hypothetical protein